MNTTRSRTPPPDLARYRMNVALRAVAAMGGGYALAAAGASALALALPHLGMTRVDAVLTATMLAFVLHAVAALWAFGCASVWRAWVGIALPALLLAAPVIWLKGGF